MKKRKNLYDANFLEGSVNGTHWQVYKLDENQYDVIVSRSGNVAFGVTDSLKKADGKISVLDKNIKADIKNKS